MRKSLRVWLSVCVCVFAHTNKHMRICLYVYVCVHLYVCVRKCIVNTTSKPLQRLGENIRLPKADGEPSTLPAYFRLPFSNKS
jgi:hypothetical protein